MTIKELTEILSKETGIEITYNEIEFLDDTNAYQFIYDGNDSRHGIVNSDLIKMDLRLFYTTYTINEMVKNLKNGLLGK